MGVSIGESRHSDPIEGVPMRFGPYRYCSDNAVLTLDAHVVRNTPCTRALGKNHVLI